MQFTPQSSAWLSLIAVSCSLVSPRDYDPYYLSESTTHCPAYCSNHGTCDLSTFVCSCTAGYAPPDCSTCDTGYSGYPSCESDCTGEGCTNQLPLKYTETFDSNANGWFTGTRSSSDGGSVTFSIEGGGYVWTLNSIGWSMPWPREVPPDVYVSVDVTVASGTPPYALSARSANGDGYFFLVFSSGSTWSIERYANVDAGSPWSVLKKGSAPLLRQGQTNNIAFATLGARLRFFLNGTIIGQVTDTTYGSGHVGLLAEATDQTTAQVTFDNFKVYYAESFAGCPNNCSGHGTCDTSTGVCSCTAGYAQPACGTCDTGDAGYPNCSLP